jgi:hypothetical protein
MMKITEAKAYLEKAFDESVPATGKAANLYGELVRAINRIGYRYMNDGDHLGIGYGKETCNAAGRFIMKKCDDVVTKAICAAWNVYSDGKYEQKLDAAYIAMAEYLEANKERLQATDTEDMYDCYDQYEDRDDSEDEDDEEYDDEYDDEEEAYAY